MWEHIGRVLRGSAVHKSCLIAAVACGGVAVAHAQTSASHVGKLRALRNREDQYTQGILKKDTKLLDSVFASTFVDTNENGVIATKSEQLKRMADSPAQIESLDVDQVRTDLYDHDNMAVVTERFKVAYVVNGKKGSESGRATDVWVRQAGTWMCVAAHSSEITPPN